MALYATCDEANYDEATDACTLVTYIDVEPTWLPMISREFGAELGGAIFSAFFIAWAFRMLRQRSITG